ncbi:MAG TPA: thiamine pyrophosphate-dependent enzyme [Stellaceae bacterium]|nr:thiamine pyrophosphate-dependent enzyme [Stellaceae bacterium]
MSRANLLDRRAVVAALLAERGDLLVVAGLGAPSWDVTAAGDTPLNFPLWGAMGSAAMIGLGLALAQPKRAVLVITGDGEMLMGLGSLATIGVQRPANLTVAVLDNESYGETGMQSTHTAHGVDLAAIAAACGFKTAELVREMAGVDALRRRLARRQGPLFAQVKIAADSLPLVMPPREGGILKNRFRAALLGPDAALA